MHEREAVSEPREPAAAAGDGLPGGGVASHLAALLVDAGLLTPEQLRHGQRVQSKVSSTRTLLSILTELRYVDMPAIRRTLRTNRPALPLGAVLVELGYLTEPQLKLALALQQERPGTPLGEILSEHNFVQSGDVFGVLADLRGLIAVEPEQAALDIELLRQAPMRQYRSHTFLPLRRDLEGVLIAFADPLNRAHVETARHLFGSDVQVGVASRKSLAIALDRAEKLLAAPASGGAGDESPIVAAVHDIINSALEQQASDIHFEPLRDRMRIRFRQDGAMTAHREVPPDMAQAMVSRIKVMAGADIAERRRHQDGRILFETRRGTVDIRVSIYVSIHGEKVVLRLLNNRGALLGIRDIGMSQRMLEYLENDVLDAPSGVVIITGPTGSGKTTTLYASVNHLNDADTSIITAEDPVEYVIDGISQCSINPKINLSYEETLKHIMRQDPDVIVIGEIRDQFSAEVAINAALTGHKVLTTFHTEDSIGGLVRLMNMNIEAFLISSTVISVIAQRLLRRVCGHCAEDHVLTPHELRRLGYAAADAAGLTFRRGTGCPHCRHTGYRGRVAVFELLVLNERVRDAVIARKTSFEIRRISTETSGLVTLLEDGIAKAADGDTTFEEIIRELPRLSAPRPLAELRRLLGVKE